MGFFGLKAGISMNHSGCGPEFSIGSSESVSPYDFLSQKLVGRAVPYPRISGNIVFEWPILNVAVSLRFEIICVP